MSDVLIIQEAATAETVEPGKAASLAAGNQISPAYHLINN
jgi:hypothetical protein